MHVEILIPRSSILGVGILGCTAPLLSSLLVRYVVDVVAGISILSPNNDLYLEERLRLIISIWVPSSAEIFQCSKCKQCTYKLQPRASTANEP